jgi:hypothetical protein
MTRNLKALGLTLIATFALGAMSAAPAVATDVFTAESEEEVTTASGTAVLTTTVGPSFKCTTAHFAGTITNGATEGTVNASYSGEAYVIPHTTECSTSYGPMTVTMNECAYILSGETDENGDARIWIECGEKPIELEITDLFTLSIPEQTPTAGGVSYTNNTPSAGLVTVYSTMEGFTFSCEPHFFCTLHGIPAEGDGFDYASSIVAKGASGAIEVSEE